MIKKIAFLLAFALQNTCFADVSPFPYDLHLHSIPGKSSNTMILFHGFGGNYKIAENLKSTANIDATLISFNFPDHDVIKMYFHPADICYGTIQEILPALYVVKKYVIDNGLESIDLYGYSAGGGAIINLLAVLNSFRYKTELMELGITPEVKWQMLEAIQNGLVILDTPLKSVEEIIDLRGRSTELDFIANNYRDNDLTQSIL